MALAKLRAVFPDVSPQSIDSLERAFSVLVASAGARDPLTRSAAALHARLSDESGKASASLKVFKALAEDASWPAKDLAHVRLLLHFNRPEDALALCESRPSMGAAAVGLHALALVHRDKARALDFFAAHEATLDADGDVNRACLVHDVKGRAEAEPLWRRALERHPSSLAAMVGSGQLKHVLDAKLRASDDVSRQAQALITLAAGSREAQRAVTAEGLLRSAIGLAEKIKDVKVCFAPCMLRRG